MPKDKSHIQHAKTFQQIAGNPSTSVHILIKSGTACTDCRNTLNVGDIAIRDPNDFKIVCLKCYGKRIENRRRQREHEEFEEREAKREAKRKQQGTLGA